MAVNEMFWSAERVSLLVGPTTGDPIVLSGDPVRVGSLNAVAITDAARSVTAYTNGGLALTANTSVNRVPTGNEPGYASCKTTGAFRHVVTAASAIAIGDPIYAIANGTGTVKKVTLTTSASGNKLYGVAIEAAASGTPTIGVKIVEITV